MGGGGRTGTGGAARARRTPGTRPLLQPSTSRSSPSQPRAAVPQSVPAGCGAACSTQGAGEGGDGSPAGPLDHRRLRQAPCSHPGWCSGVRRGLGCESGHGQRSRGSLWLFDFDLAACTGVVWAEQGLASPKMQPNVGRITGHIQGWRRRALGTAGGDMGAESLGARTRPRGASCASRCAFVRAHVQRCLIILYARAGRLGVVLFKKRSILCAIPRTPLPPRLHAQTSSKLQAASVCCLGLPFPTPGYARNPTHQKNTGT